MEKLANLTQTDINNGALIRILANAGIPDVQEYVRNFHQATEDLILEDFEHSHPHTVDNDEQIVPPADIQRWIAGLRPRLDNSSQQLLPKKQEQQQLTQNVQSLIMNLGPDRNHTAHTDSIEQHPLPGDIQSWITGLQPRLDKPIQPSPREQQQEKQPPTDLTSWMQGIAPVNLHSSTDIITTQTITTVDDDDGTPVIGNLGTWLNDWSKSLAQQPPPTSLDNWLQSLVSNNINEPIGKAASSKGRLNSYLNAAQQVLSQHGYDVSNKVTPPTSVETKTGMFGNVKQMYFLVSSTLLSLSLSNLYIFVCCI
jgi:hypothetical protein